MWKGGHGDNLGAGGSDFDFMNEKKEGLPGQPFYELRLKFFLFDGDFLLGAGLFFRIPKFQNAIFHFGVDLGYVCILRRIRLRR
jgi:hypothetical protein